MLKDIFLEGEKINLCVPQERDLEEWASWFNSQTVTQYLDQGKFPNTMNQQRRFIEEAEKNGRFLTLIKTKEGKLLGVISLSEINYSRRECQVSYVCPIKDKTARFAPLEALAITTQHAFKRLGMIRIYSGHAFPGLSSWIQKTELLGYRTEGIFQHEFWHGQINTDSARTAITLEMYESLLRARGGSLWPGEFKFNIMLEHYQQLPSLVSKVSSSINCLYAEHETRLLGLLD